MSSSEIFDILITSAFAVSLGFFAGISARDHIWKRTKEMSDFAINRLARAEHYFKLAQQQMEEVTKERDELVKMIDQAKKTNATMKMFFGIKEP